MSTSPEPNNNPARPIAQKFYSEANAWLREVADLTRKVYSGTATPQERLKWVQERALLDWQGKDKLARMKEMYGLDPTELLRWEGAWNTLQRQIYVAIDPQTPFIMQGINADSDIQWYTDDKGYLQLVSGGKQPPENAQVSHGSFSNALLQASSKPVMSDAPLISLLSHSAQRGIQTLKRANSDYEAAPDINITAIAGSMNTLVYELQTMKYAGNYEETEWQDKHRQLQGLAATFGISQLGITPTIYAKLPPAVQHEIVGKVIRSQYQNDYDTTQMNIGRSYSFGDTLMNFLIGPKPGIVPTDDINLSTLYALSTFRATAKPLAAYKADDQRMAAKQIAELLSQVTGGRIDLGADTLENLLTPIYTILARQGLDAATLALATKIGLVQDGNVTDPDKYRQLQGFIEEVFNGPGGGVTPIFRHFSSRAMHDEAIESAVLLTDTVVKSLSPSQYKEFVTVAKHMEKQFGWQVQNVLQPIANVDEFSSDPFENLDTAATPYSRRNPYSTFRRLHEDQKAQIQEQVAFSVREALRAYRNNQTAFNEPFDKHGDLGLDAYYSSGLTPTDYKVRGENGAETLSISPTGVDRTRLPTKSPYYRAQWLAREIKSYRATEITEEAENQAIHQLQQELFKNAFTDEERTELSELQVRVQGAQSTQIPQVIKGYLASPETSSALNPSMQLKLQSVMGDMTRADYLVREQHIPAKLVPGLLKDRHRGDIESIKEALLTQIVSDFTDVDSVSIDATAIQTQVENILEFITNTTSEDTLRNLQQSYVESHPPVDPSLISAIFDRVESHSRAIQAADRYLQAATTYKYIDNLGSGIQDWKELSDKQGAETLADLWITAVTGNQQSHMSEEQIQNIASLGLVQAANTNTSALDMMRMYGAVGGHLQKFKVDAGMTPTVNALAGSIYEARIRQLNQSKPGMRIDMAALREESAKTAAQVAGSLEMENVALVVTGEFEEDSVMAKLQDKIKQGEMITDAEYQLLGNMPVFNSQFREDYVDEAVVADSLLAAAPSVMRNLSEENQALTINTSLEAGRRNQLNRFNSSRRQAIKNSTVGKGLQRRMENLYSLSSDEIASALETLEAITGSFDTSKEFLAGRHKLTDANLRELDRIQADGLVAGNVVNFIHTRNQPNATKDDVLAGQIADINQQTETSTDITASDILFTPPDRGESELLTQVLQGLIKGDIDPTLMEDARNKGVIPTILQRITGASSGLTAEDAAKLLKNGGALVAQWWLRQSSLPKEHVLDGSDSTAIINAVKAVAGSSVGVTTVSDALTWLQNSTPEQAKALYNELSPDVAARLTAEITGIQMQQSAIPATLKATPQALPTPAESIEVPAIRTEDPGVSTTDSAEDGGPLGAARIGTTTNNPMYVQVINFPDNLLT